MVKKIRLSCVEGTIHPKLLKGPFILSFVEGRPLGERTGEGELRVVTEVEMRNVEPSEALN